ncbi:MAG: response regulator, partial [Leptospiraceae bacterium]|nr:response regulator [Leptospiraceae bacterium]
LLALINDVLDLTKIEAGRISLSMEPIELKKVIEDCLALAHTLATKRSVRIHTHLETPSSLFVMADFTRIKQVLLNLLSNAVKYNHKEGSVIIKTKILDDEYVRIQVDDSGFGIPEEKHKDLFQSFSRLGQEKSQIEGTGIGLVITKKIIEAMNGRMGFSSEGGKGSSFWFELKYTIKIKDSPEASLPYDKSISIGVEKKRLIIYIEDNPANIVLMEEVIGNYPGLQLMSIHNAELGIELIIKEKPDLVIMDINLPGMSGIEAIEKIKMNPDIKDIPVIALSANVTFSDSRKGKELGFMEYIAKPIKVNELLFTLQKVLNI